MSLGLARSKCAVAALATGLFAAAQVNAAVISVNFDTIPSSTAAIGAAETAGAVPAINWNNIPSDSGGGFAAPTQIFVDDSAAATTLKVASSGGGSNSWNTGGTPDQRLNGDFLANATSVTFSDVPYAAYDLYVYSNIWGQNTTKFTIGTDVQTLAELDSSNPLQPALVEGHNYVKFTGLTGDSVMTITRVSGESAVGAFQIVEAAVPEPASLGLLSLGALAGLRRRRNA